MRAYNLKPTLENLMRTFINDTIDRNEDILRFITILNAIDDSCSIALDGNWGSGKTFFVKQCKLVLDAYNNHISEISDEDRLNIKKVCSKYSIQELSELEPQVCVYYDAWENDNDNDPIFSLVHTILNSVYTDFSFNDTSSCIEKAASIMEVFTGRNCSQLIEKLKNKTFLDELKKTKDVEQLIKEFLTSLLFEKGNRLVIFIDELDRCKPSYAVSLLERIKHYFSDDKITFVFSINTNELQHTIQKYYGNEFNGLRYLDRFFDLRITLPPVSLDKFYRTFNFNDNDYTFNIVCDAVIKTFHFELREIAKYIHLMKIAVYTPANMQNNRFYTPKNTAEIFCLDHIVPIIIGLKLYSTKKYDDFINGKDCSPLIDVNNVFDSSFFQNLLNYNETYNISDTSKIHVSVEEKLKRIYNALFVPNYINKIRYLDIGNMRIEKDTKLLLTKVASSLSKYTNTNID